MGLEGDASFSGKVPAPEFFGNLIYLCACFFYFFFFLSAFASVLGEDVCWALLFFFEHANHNILG